MKRIPGTWELVLDNEYFPEESSDLTIAPLEDDVLHAVLEAGRAAGTQALIIHAMEIDEESKTITLHVQ